ncbi:MAG: phosphomannomutase/phosphoglucomutase [Proteobacteria bacterium]|nr:phosphomannomutase/phosphoglucomutase [Pseudomonadota bacterium]
MSVQINKAPPHVLANEILRKYDIRGRVGGNIKPQDAYYIGLSYATYARKQGLIGAVCVGYDGRISSPMLEAELARGLTDGGLDVVRIGLVATPVLYFATYHIKQAIGGIMITGSHNPPDENGFKMVLNRAPLFDEAIIDLGRLAATGECVLYTPGHMTEYSIIETYVQNIIEASGLAQQSGLKIAWDPGNGAVGSVLPALAGKLAGKHIKLNMHVDGNFPAHHPDPSVKANLAQLQAAVLGHGCDVGFAFDGDGDRLGVVDNSGNILSGDQLLLILARDLLQRKPGSKIIADVKTSDVVFRKIEEWGGVPIMWKTGHSFIKTKMAEENAIMAGEMSGHLFFAEDYYGFDDAILAALKVLDILARAKKPLSTLLADLPVMVGTPEIRIDCVEERKFAIIEELKALLDQHAISYLDLDGVRVRLANGWWLLRASNTQSCLVMRAEGDDEATLEKIVATAKDMLRQVII